MIIAQALKDASELLENSGIPEYRREATSLLSHALDKGFTFQFAHPEYELTPVEAEKFTSFVSRRAAREPFQYIVGHQEFYGLEFAVRPGVLIPRPETEILVSEAIELSRSCAEPKLLEIGVGSGCISISILHHVAAARIDAVDISDTALEVAAENAAKHDVSDRLSLFRSDVFSSVNGKFDLIVSNPPYIPSSDLGGIQPEVGLFEPHTALFSGKDGLSVIRRLVNEAPGHLKPGGYLLIEFGFGQSESVKELFDPFIWSDVEIIPDQRSIPRVIKGRLAPRNY